MPLLTHLPIIPFLLATYLGTTGVHKKSLSPSGGLAAFLVGFTMLSVPLRAFGVSLIVFYLVGSKATKVGKEKKKRLEDGHQEAGYRSATQVLCNSCAAWAAAGVWGWVFVFGEGVGRRGRDGFGEWCPVLSLTVDDDVGKLSRALLFVTLG